MPTNVCEACLDALEISDKLRVQSLEADSILREQLRINIISRDIKQEKDPLNIDNDAESVGTNCNDSDRCNEESNADDDVPESKPLDNYNDKQVGGQDEEFIIPDETGINSDIVNTNNSFTTGTIQDSIFIKEESIVSHGNDLLPTENKTYCDICKITIKEKKLMDNHIKFHQPRPMFCVRCFRNFPSPYDLYIHKKIVHKIGSKVQLKWFCESCEKMTDKRETALEHMHQCISPKFPCEYCNLQFTFKSALAIHRKKNHLKFMLADPECKKFKCHHCEKCFVDRNTFTHHVKFHEPVEVEKFECPTCKKFFGSASILKNHIEAAHQDNDLEDAAVHECDVCSVSYASARALALHKRKHTEHICSVCERKFKYGKLLRQHLREVHNVDPPPSRKYICDQCDATFTRLSHLQDHQTKHTGKSRYTCNICNKTSKTYATHWSHKLTHKAMVFRCDICNKKLATKSGMRKHIVTMHQSPEDWTFKCDYCDLKFPSNESLQNHRKKCTDTQKLSCDSTGGDVRQQAALASHKRRKRAE
uniref:C2H2-type domain-containing protein n=1 Tax=Bracon brevicornis TaxID=1563983 RepID=A0A6V7HZE9_9HYME